MASLFVYGSLIDPEIFSAVTGITPHGSPATLPGFMRFRVKGEAYPAVITSEFNTVEGLLYDNLSDSTIAQLDLFEGEEYNRITATVNVAGIEKTAQLYRYNESFSHKISSEKWSFEEFCLEKENFLELCKQSNWVNSR